jgi:squalene-hopene/tetraprenyl-beta-curcumene cyclase
MLNPGRLQPIDSDTTAMSANPFGADVIPSPDPDMPLAGFNSMNAAVHAGLTRLHAERCTAGNWCYEFEADCTIPAEFLLLVHFTGDFGLLDELGSDVEARIAKYIQSHQHVDGGWSLYPGGAFDISCSVKAYYALKLAGDAVDAPHMERARGAILAYGGASKSNVFTHVTLALFEQIPWRGVPFIPVEMMLFPRWFPFHLSKVSYWSRAVMVPLSILCSLKAKATNPRGIGIEELFVTPPALEREWFPVRSFMNRLFQVWDATARTFEPLIPSVIRDYAVKKALNWVSERVVGDDGLGAIFPAMVNAHEALMVTGHDASSADFVRTREALKRLIVLKDDVAYVQPCVSPVWDTALACLASQQASGLNDEQTVLRALDWLVECQLSDEPGDWRENRPHLKGGGWPFQYENPHYPDVDDTAAVGWAMHQADPVRYAEPIERAAHWVAGMQSSNGGFAAFDVDNTYYYLNEIPFADHGALLDPPTADVTARCISFLALDGPKTYATHIERAIEFLLAEQEPSGSWFGRWGTNYVYGTWSVLTALELAGFPREHQSMRRAVNWLESIQRDDGSWGESNDSYLDERLAGHGNEGTAFQTAWAILGLLAAGEGDSAAVRGGTSFLMRTQRRDGLWYDREFTAPGFPKVFYLKYHGYSRYFPLWALGRYAREHAAA